LRLEDSNMFDHIDEGDRVMFVLFGIGGIHKKRVDIWFAKQLDIKIRYIEQPADIVEDEFRDSELLY
jgi:hypothetical protein